uniref:Protein-serine/threonine phosphatase n=1 Tax=viral metagenome TaxID=1070528 RepID=A0A6C0I776_9ZZZZ
MTPLGWFRTQLHMRRRRSRGFIHDPVANPFPRIWVGNGSRLTPDFMKAFSITHIINCADDGACPSHVKTSVPYTCLEAIDSVQVHIFNTWYAKFKETMDAYLQDPLCRGVYVHCQAGMNRSAFLAAAYVIKTFRIPFAECIVRMVSQRPCVMTNPAFQAQLIDFVKR